jgi:ornithine decarboxylase
VLISRLTLKKFLEQFTRANPTVGAFYTLSQTRFLRQWSLWNRGLPGIKPHYAVKCNPEPTLLKWIKERGGGFDCASSREMYAVKEIYKEWTPKDVIFANPCKTPNDIQTGRYLGVPIVTADSCEELLKMDKMKYKPSILLRLDIDDATATSPFGEKFGLPLEKLGETAFAAHGLGIPLVGLCFHIGSGSQSPEVYKKAVMVAKETWETLQRGGLVGDMEVLDLGGGWSPEEKKFLEATRMVQEGLASGKGAVPKRILAEPGRFFAAPCMDLYVRVIGKKPMATGQGWRYTIDESIYGQFSCIPFDHAEPRIARLGTDVRPKSKAVVFGRTCDSLDIIAKHVAMEELEVGDWLYFPNMGAYTTATSSEFNGFPKPVLFETGTEPEEVDMKWIESMQWPLGKMLDVRKACEL